jgi:dihydrofolate reductase
MRRIVMFNRVTVEGYFAGSDGNLNWITPDNEFDKEAARGLPGVDTILLGRRTYELFESFWPHVLNGSPTAPDPHQPGHVSPEMRAMAVMLNESTKLVFSRTMKEGAWKNTRLLRTLDPREVATLKNQPGRDMIVLGSGSIVSQLTQHGLIDEYQFFVSPILLGSGQPLFQGLPVKLALALHEARAYPSGNVMLRYHMLPTVRRSTSTAGR